MLLPTSNQFNNMNNVLSGFGIGTNVFVLIDNLGTFIAAKFQGTSNNGLALFQVDGVLIRVPQNQVFAVAA